MSEELLGDLGLMFDAHHSKQVLEVSLEKGLRVSLKGIALLGLKGTKFQLIVAISTDPGHKQSGQ